MTTVFEFTSFAEIPVSVTVQLLPEVKTTRHVDGNPEHFEILSVKVSKNIEDDILEKHYSDFQEEARDYV